MYTSYNFSAFVEARFETRQLRTKTLVQPYQNWIFMV